MAISEAESVSDTHSSYANKDIGTCAEDKPNEQPRGPLNAGLEIVQLRYEFQIYRNLSQIPPSFPLS